MNDIKALANRIKNPTEDSHMTIEQVPLPYQEAVQALLEGENDGNTVT